MKFAPLIAALIALGFLTGEAGAAAIGGRHGRDEIKATCHEVGGDYWSNLNGFGCKNKCTKDGKECEVNCKNDGVCQGFTPALTAGGDFRPGVTVDGVLGGFSGNPPRGTTGFNPGGAATTGQ